MTSVVERFRDKLATVCVRKGSPREMIRYIKTHKKDLFWVWIAYQTVKGLLTTSLIWIPLFLIWKG